MSGHRFLAAGLVLAFFLASGVSSAQTPHHESIEIGLNADRITITSGFQGTNLTIFGALDGADPQLAREGRYDVIVVLQGPPQPLIVRRKARILGMWINVQSKSFRNVPASYTEASTRAPQDITSPKTYRELALGPNYIYLEPVIKDDPEEVKEFTQALRTLKKASALYSVNPGGVEFLSSTLFRATLPLPPDIPVGTHIARAYLFRSGQFVMQKSAQLEIVKSDFERSVYETAHNHSFYYGAFCVLLAMGIGWGGRFVFRRD
ncbi:MAG TPA: TIGR02186 family protein [Rhizobiaceae bacterium]|jgi:uncharacterized protein (TIGR02186 family)|nr:TIGR02186 family protein [Rhizobiaceae bacterium]